jgi:Tfp pilus assembly protein PilF
MGELTRRINEQPAMQAIRERWTRTTTVAAVISVIVLILMVLLPLLLIDGSEETPENMSAALAALGNGNEAGARKKLNDAIESSDEPMKAKAHARDALDELKAGRTGSAQNEIELGAANERFASALNALNDDKKGKAKRHLKRALSLPPASSLAQSALDAIDAGRIKAAKQDLRDGKKL